MEGQSREWTCGPMAPIHAQGQLVSSQPHEGCFQSFPICPRPPPPPACMPFPPNNVAPNFQVPTPDMSGMPVGMPAGMLNSAQRLVVPQIPTAAHLPQGSLNAPESSSTPGLSAAMVEAQAMARAMASKLSNRISNGESSINTPFPYRGNAPRAVDSCGGGAGGCAMTCHAGAAAMRSGSDERSDSRNGGFDRAHRMREPQRRSRSRSRGRSPDAKRRRSRSASRDRSTSPRQRSPRRRAYPFFDGDHASSTRGGGAHPHQMAPAHLAGPGFNGGMHSRSFPAEPANGTSRYEPRSSAAYPEPPRLAPRDDSASNEKARISSSSSERKEKGVSSGGSRHAGSEEQLFAKFKEAVVEAAKSFLREPYERKELSRDDFKQIVKKVAEKARHRATLATSISDTLIADAPECAGRLHLQEGRRQASTQLRDRCEAEVEARKVGA